MSYFFQPGDFGLCRYKNESELLIAIENKDLELQFKPLYKGHPFIFSPMSATAFKVSTLTLGLWFTLSLGLVYCSPSFRNCLQIYNKKLEIILLPSSALAFEIL